MPKSTLSHFFLLLKYVSQMQTPDKDIPAPTTQELEDPQSIYCRTTCGNIFVSQPRQWVQVRKRRRRRLSASSSSCDRITCSDHSLVFMLVLL